MANRDTLTRTGVGAALNISQHDQNINSLASATDVQTGTTYTVLYTDQNKLIELNNATMTCTLSALSTISGAKDTDDWHVAIKNINSADATLNCNAADTFDGGGTSITLPQHASVVLQTNNDETVWRIASSSIGTMAEQLVLSGATAGTAVASKALVVDANKDIDLGTGDLTATQITGTLQTASQPNVTDIGTQTSADINGGAIDGTPIGASSASTGAFTNVTASGTVTVTSTTTLNGHVVLGSDASDNLTFNGDVVGHVTPQTDNTYDLGGSSLQWRNLYVNGTGFIDAIQLSSGSTCTVIRDEDTMSSNSNTSLCTQQSIKAYVDSEVSGAPKWQLVGSQYNLSGSSTENGTNISSSATQVYLVITGASSTSDGTLDFDLKGSSYTGSGSNGAVCSFSTSAGGTAWPGSGVGLLTPSTLAAYAYDIVLELKKCSSNIWMVSGYGGNENVGQSGWFSSGRIAVNAALTKVRLKPAAGTWDSGNVRMYQYY